MSNDKWKGLHELPDKFLVDMFCWSAFKAQRTEGHHGGRILVNAILNEAQRRKWPAGWWKDTSRVPDARMEQEERPATAGEVRRILAMEDGDE